MKLICIGDNCVDRYADLGKEFPGGNPVNVAVFFKEMGGESSYLGAVGNDDEGQMIVNCLKNREVDVSRVQVKEGQTAYCEVRLNNGDREFITYEPGVSLNYDILARDFEYIQTHDMIFSARFGEIVDELKILSDMPIAFDLADIRDDELARRVLPYSDVVFCSAHELMIQEIYELLVSLAAYGPKIVVATRGDRGVIAYNHEKFYELREQPVEAVDTLGAGDSFIAGFLYGYLEAKDIDECLRMGAGKAVQVLDHVGAWSCKK